jgi:predicted nucleotidyltransferase component of viral defense system
MTIPSPISRQQLAAINKRSLHYAIDTAEKDYHIALALSLIADSPLKSLLVFKGGTALHHCYLPQYRFSEDIDFSTLQREGLALETVKDALEHGGLFEVRKEYVSGATIKIERLRYLGILDQPRAIKVEIDHLQNIVLPP